MVILEINIIDNLQEENHDGTEKVANDTEEVLLSRSISVAAASSDDAKERDVNDDGENSITHDAEENNNLGRI